MKKNKVLMLAVIVLLVSLSLAGCGGSKDTAGNEGSQAPAKDKVTFAVINDYPPFEYKDNGKLTGFDVELIEAIAKQQNFEVEWKEMKFDGIIPALQGNQVDGAVSAITIRPDRAEVVNFATPYFKSGLSLVVRKDNAIQKMEDLKDKTIVAKQGTTGLEKARELAEQYGAKVKVLQDDTALYLEVETGNSDATINDFPGAAYKIKIDGEKSNLRIFGEKLTGEDYGIAISKSNTELLEKVNTGLKAIQENGEFDKLYAKYFGQN